MFGLIFLLLIVVPVVELYVLFQVADSFGWAFSLLSLLAISLIGAALVKWQTSGQFARINEKIQSGQMPSKELTDGALMIFGGALLLTPGFFTDAFGLAMFIPPLRAVASKAVVKRMSGRVTAFAGPGAASFGGAGFGATFGTAGFGKPGSADGPTARRRPQSFIDVDEVHAERVDDYPSPKLPPPGHTP